MPKFLHTSDLHINALRKYSGYLQRMRRTLNGILTVAQRSQVEVIVVAGDICDRLDMTHSERQLLSEWLASSSIPIIAISGNHDKRSEEIGDTCISYLASLSSRFTNHIIYDGVPKVVALHGFRFLLIPYQGWMDQEIYLIVESLLSDVPQDDTPNIVVLHEAVYGCVNDVGRSVTKNNQVRLDNSFPRVAYWALGDMHKQQAILPNAWYCGAPHQTRFDETPNKGVLIVDTDKPTEPEFVTIPSASLVVLENEPVDGWPEVTDSLVQYCPTSTTVMPSQLPDNVMFHPAVVTQVLLPRPGESSTAVLDGLDNVLSRTGLDPGLFPLAWRIAVKLVNDLGIETEIPKEYQEES